MNGTSMVQQLQGQRCSCGRSTPTCAPVQRQHATASLCSLGKAAAHPHPALRFVNPPPPPPCPAPPSISTHSQFMTDSNGPMDKPGPGLWMDRAWQRGAPRAVHVRFDGVRSMQARLVVQTITPALPCHAMPCHALLPVHTSICIDALTAV